MRTEFSNVELSDGGMLEIAMKSIDTTDLDSLLINSTPCWDLQRSPPRFQMR